MKKNNHSIVYPNKKNQPNANPRGEVSQKRADLKQKADLQKGVVEQDLKKFKKDAGKVLLVAGAALLTFQVVKSLTKEKEKPTPTPAPNPNPNPPREEPPPVQNPTEPDKGGFGNMLFGWIKGQVISYAAEKVKNVVWNYVQSRINKQENAEEDTSDSDREETKGN